jgi:hypothetical protein
MAAESLGCFIEDFKREHDGQMPGIIETWYAAIDFAGANKPSHNTGSPKLPCFTDWSVFAASQGLSPAQAHEVAAWIARQLRADA